MMGREQRKKADRKNWEQTKMILKQNKAKTFENKTVNWLKIFKKIKLYQPIKLVNVRL